MTIDRMAAAHLILIALTYFICFGAYALVDVPFWDDWVILQYGNDGLWGLFQQLGRREHYFLIAPFVFSGIPILWAITSFLCWGTVPIAAYLLLRGLGWSGGNAFWAGVLTSAVPLNQARFALAMLPYAFSAAFFAIGVLALVYSVVRHMPWLRVLAAVCFVMSFPTNSFLSISWLAPTAVFLAARSLDPARRPLPALRRALLHTELFVLPVAYWVVKSNFQRPYGLYENYNRFQMGPIDGLVMSARQLIRQRPDWSTFFPTQDHFVEASILAAGVTFVLLATAALSRTLIATEKTKWTSAWLPVCVLGLAAIAAIFPYVMVGIRPDYHGLWETRHQTTLALVAGLLAFATIRAALPNRLVPAACAALLCNFITLDISASRQLLADTYESKAIVHSPAIAMIPPGTMVGIFEQDTAYRMFGRHFQYYDASSMLNAHAKKKSLVAMSSFEVIDPASQTYPVSGSEAFPAAVAVICNSAIGLPQYGFGDFTSNGQFAEVTLRPKGPPPTFLGGLAIAAQFLFDGNGALKRATDNVDVTVVMRRYDAGPCSTRCCQDRARAEEP